MANAFIECNDTETTLPQVPKDLKNNTNKKPKKPENLTSSYRPVSNLQVYEKVIGEVLKSRLTKYFENNNIIIDEHHGGRRNHSTVSAKAVLEEASKKTIDKNKLGVVISTDLTTAFDTVNYQVLIKKLQFY